MPSFATNYECRACGKTFPVEVTDLGDPYRHIPGRTQETMRRAWETQNTIAIIKIEDPVCELAEKLLAQEARSVLLRATCPECNARNPEGIAADRADARQSKLLGLGIFGVLALISWFYPKVALILPGMDLLVFRPMMFVEARKITDKPFPVLPFVTGILFDFLLVAAILSFPRFAWAIPIFGIIQSLFTRSSKYEWRWEGAAKQLRFGEGHAASS